MPAAKFEIKRKCKECGAVFLAKTIESWYCSKKCTEKASKRRKAEEAKKATLNHIVEQIPDARDYISVQEAMAMFNIGRNTIYRLIRKGNIKSINIGERLTRVSKEELSNMFDTRDNSLAESKPLPKVYSLEPEDCYTIGEIAEKFHFDDSTIYKHIRKYSIPTRQIGNFVYVPKSEIDKLYK